MRDYDGLTWTGEDGSINYVLRHVNDYTVEILQDIQADLKREGCTHDDDGEVDPRLRLALRSVEHAIGLLKEYVDDSFIVDRKYAKEQRGE